MLEYSGLHARGIVVSQARRDLHFLMHGVVVVNESADESNNDDPSGRRRGQRDFFNRLAGRNANCGENENRGEDPPRQGGVSVMTGKHLGGLRRLASALQPTARRHLAWHRRGNAVYRYKCASILAGPAKTSPRNAGGP